ncbi:DHH family phosphoesterase [Sulfurimonas sp. HSL-3221]|uniref:DHH family phosphoesterase n=1 Tax=Sulfurimonadaceae TaxID=2771471 RepID=UPI001E5DA078|nr:DHH family phosphoesterase [Sulfurimonas sp. HSL-3221]UFS61932.1 DHH family phosphoesterase [Sulfurimonas sp. HSL-3221]
MREAIEAAEHIALIAHVHPDADSLGSACAMYAHLLRLQKRVTLFCASEAIDERLFCLPWADKITSRWDETADLAIAFDCGDSARLGVLPKCTLINVDHHGSNDGFGHIKLIDKEAVSTTAVLLTWFKTEAIKINAKMATALYAGITEDTLGFMSRRTDAAVFEMAAELARAGAEVVSVNHALFLRRPLSALRLKALMLSSLALRSDARIALLQVTRAMMEQSGADDTVCDDVLQEVLGLPTVCVAVMLCEREAGVLKVSLRTDDGIDVGVIAEAFGGGGHHFASGFTATGTALERLSEKMIDIIEKELE